MTKTKMPVEVYRKYQNDIASIIDSLQKELAAHAVAAARRPNDWGWVDDLDHIHEGLDEVLFNAQLMNTKSDRQAKRLIGNHVEAMSAQKEH